MSQISSVLRVIPGSAASEPPLHGRRRTNHGARGGELLCRQGAASVDICASSEKPSAGKSSTPMTLKASLISLDFLAYICCLTTSLSTMGWPVAAMSSICCVPDQSTAHPDLWHDDVHHSPKSATYSRFNSWACGRAKASECHIMASDQSNTIKRFCE